MYLLHFRLSISQSFTIPSSYQRKRGQGKPAMTSTNQPSKVEQLQHPQPYILLNLDKAPATLNPTHDDPVAVGILHTHWHPGRIHTLRTRRGHLQPHTHTAADVAAGQNQVVVDNKIAGRTLVDGTAVGAGEKGEDEGR